MDEVYKSLILNIVSTLGGSVDIRKVALLCFLIDKETVKRTQYRYLDYERYERNEEGMIFGKSFKRMINTLMHEERLELKKDDDVTLVQFCFGRRPEAPRLEKGSAHVVTRVMRLYRYSGIDKLKEAANAAQQKTLL